MSKMSSRGYTILELLVVVGIIAALSAVVLSNYPKIKLHFALSKVAYKFEQDLRRVQRMSLSDIEYQDSTGQPRPVAGFGGYVNEVNNKQYILYADSEPGNQQYDGASIDYVVEVVNFSLINPGIIIKEITNNIGLDASINFKPPSPVTTLTPSPADNILRVVFAVESDPAKTKTVLINKAGLIEVE